MLSSKDDEGEGKVSKTDQAKQLLAQYGSAYLITSISFAIVSFAICYFAVNSGGWGAMRIADKPGKRLCWNHSAYRNFGYPSISRSHDAHTHPTHVGCAAATSGVDMSSLLSKIGLQVNDTNETVSERSVHGVATCHRSIVFFIQRS